MAHRLLKLKVNFLKNLSLPQILQGRIDWSIFFPNNEIFYKYVKFKAIS